MREKDASEEESSSPPVLPKIENVPLTEQARKAILDAIMDKRFDVRLPSEEELATTLNVSRTSIRTALHSLEQDGIVTRKRAIGTIINAHVRPSTLALQRMVGFDGLLREKGYEVEVEIEWRRGIMGEEYRAYGLDPDQAAMLTEKTYLAGGSPAIYIRDAIPWSNLRNPEFDGEIPASIYEFAASHWKTPVDHVVVEILPKVKDSPGTTALAIDIGTAFTRLQERLYAATGEMLAASMVDADTAFVRFEISRRR